jgi:ParB family chromosome partitioning protein
MVKRLQAVKSAKPSKSEGSSLDPDIRRLQTELGDTLGAKVAIQHSASGKNKGSGKLIISYNNVDELDGILKHLK